MVVGITKYEDIRQKRLEENKRRMEELKLPSLSNDLRKSAMKPSPAKKVKITPNRRIDSFFEVRRSSRVAKKPAPNYKETNYDDRRLLGRRIYSRPLLMSKHASNEARTFAIEKAETIQSGLDPQFPSFVKPMLHSHVAVGFWLGLSVEFCKLHLPKRDTIMILEDEDGKVYETKFLALKTGLSAGWRGFAIAHELIDGDAVIFQLVELNKFKVYIVRAIEPNSEN
ncbi:B3 domain-containing protein [Nymphaea thermarum]|nr:B3 domain-containing protein [Nymphaea thermarum]